MEGAKGDPEAKPVRVNVFFYFMSVRPRRKSAINIYRPVFDFGVCWLAARSCPMSPTVPVQVSPTFHSFIYRCAVYDYRITLRI